MSTRRRQIHIFLGSSSWTILFGLKFEETIVIFEISPLKFVIMLGLKQKNFELETKNVLLGDKLESYGVSLRIQSECGKAVHLFQKFFLRKHNMRRNYIIKSLLNLVFSFFNIHLYCSYIDSNLRKFQYIFK